MGAQGLERTHKDGRFRMWVVPEFGSRAFGLPENGSLQNCAPSKDPTVEMLLHRDRILEC